MKSTNTSKSSNASSIDRSPPPTVFPGGSSIAVALNPSSGDGGWTNRDVAGVEERFREAGWEVEGFIGVSLFERLPDLFKKHDAVVVGGGDGTILAAAEEAMAADKPLGVLPMGTMNLFARDLGSPKDIVETADKLARGGIKSVDVAYMNDRLFLNNVTLGSISTFAELREALRDDLKPERLTDVLKWFVDRMGDDDAASLELTGDSRNYRFRTRAMIISNNLYDNALGQVLARPKLNSGRIGVYAERGQDPTSPFRWFASATLGVLYRQDWIWRRAFSQLTIRSEQDAIECTVDGEPARMFFPINVEAKKEALKVLDPS